MKISLSLYTTTICTHLLLNCIKIANDKSPKILNQVLKLRDISCYTLRYTFQFSTDPIRSVYNGTQLASYLRPNI